MRGQTPIELLSPAKNLEAGLAAINHGADAVYIGFERFGAREAAGNSINDIESLVKYAHIYSSKVYVTLNTILFDNELDEVQELIHNLYNIGVDAIIIQDMGILEMDLPPIPIHASTQTNNASLDKVKFLQDIGIQRVILARELSLDEIRNIRENTNIELEAFIHGALCVSFSGQCYFSQAIAGRSANRGECAQPCRSKYDLVDSNGKVLAKGKHLLSLKDLNQTENIGKLIEAGVTSLKIEGRLKDISYVKNITAYYRKVIDDLLTRNGAYCKSSSGSTKLNFVPNPNFSFSRTFTTYFSESRQGNLTTFDTQKSLGEFMGTIIIASQNWFKLSKEHTISNNDGLCFLGKNGNLEGIKVNKVEGSKVFPNREVEISKGVKVYRNYYHKFSRILLDNNSSIRTIDCNITCKISNNSIYIEVTDEDLVSSSLEFSSSFDVSQKPESIVKTIKSQLQKTGSTPYKVSKLEINLETKEVPFIQTSSINEWRRQLLEKHTISRLQIYRVKGASFKPSTIPYPEKELTYKANISNRLAKKFYLRHGVNDLELAFEMSENHKGQEIMVTKYCLLYELGFCKGTLSSQKVKNKLYLKNQNSIYPLSFNCQKCQMSVYL